VCPWNPDLLLLKDRKHVVHKLRNARRKVPVSDQCQQEVVSGDCRHRQSQIGSRYKNIPQESSPKLRQEQVTTAYQESMTFVFNPSMAVTTQPQLSFDVPPQTITVSKFLYRQPVIRNQQTICCSDNKFLLD
jgi:hypothetical protein